MTRTLFDAVSSQLGASSHGALCKQVRISSFSSSLSGVELSRHVEHSASRCGEHSMISQANILHATISFTQSYHSPRPFTGHVADFRSCKPHLSLYLNLCIIRPRSTGTVRQMCVLSTVCRLAGCLRPFVTVTVPVRCPRWIISCRSWASRSDVARTVTPACLFGTSV